MANMRVFLFMLSLYSATTANSISRGLIENCGTKCIYEAEKDGSYCYTATSSRPCTIPKPGEKVDCSEYVIPTFPPAYQAPYIHFEGYLSFPLEVKEVSNYGRDGYRVVIETTVPVIEKCEVNHPFTTATCNGTQLTVTSTGYVAVYDSTMWEIPFKVAYRDPRFFVSTIRYNERLICGSN